MTDPLIEAVAKAIRAAHTGIPCDESDRAYNQHSLIREAYDHLASAALSAVQAHQWRPISEAKKDGRDVLLFTKDGHITRGNWDVQKHSVKPRPYWKTEMGYLFGVQHDRDNAPTHFMPPPPPPGER